MGRQRLQAVSEAEPSSPKDRRVRFETFKVIDILPFYSVTEADGDKRLFRTLSEISKYYKISIPVLSRVCNGIHLPSVKFEIYKEPFPYVWEIDGERYESESESDISRMTGISRTHVGHLIKQARKTLGIIF